MYILYLKCIQVKYVTLYKIKYVWCFILNKYIIILCISMCMISINVCEYLLLIINVSK